MSKSLQAQSKQLLSSLLKESTIEQYLDRLKAHHLETYQHSIRVGLLCLNMGLELRLTKRELRLLGYAGILHDVGKRRIPKRILSKNSPLDSREKEIMQAHPRLSYLELDDGADQIVRSIVVTHHEFKVDPYPRKGSERRERKRYRAERRSPSDVIAEMGEIVAVADIFDALLSRRAYKPPMRKDKIEEVLREQFTGDQRLIDLILQIYDTKREPN
jgi:HD-GYP domain-containing protein (c-di-GMP phosphodiesterase class II)